jgi:hypothetical protein
MTTPTIVSSRLGGPAAATAGSMLVVLGAIGAFWPAAASASWFVAAGIAAALLVVGLLGLRARVADIPVARHALAVAAGAMALFALAHFYALVDEDLAILLFSVLMVLTSLATIVAGVAILRAGAGQGWRRVVPLVCGVWPILTVPAGAALGDVPHFLAIAVWGLCWIALGVSLSRPARERAPQAVR